MDDAQIAAIRRRLEDVQPKWEEKELRGMNYMCAPLVSVEADREFRTHAMEDVEDLLDEIDRLRKENDRQLKARADSLAEIGNAVRRDMDRVAVIEQANRELAQKNEALQAELAKAQNTLDGAAESASIDEWVINQVKREFVAAGRKSPLWTQVPERVKEVLGELAQAREEVRDDFAVIRCLRKEWEKAEEGRDEAVEILKDTKQLIEARWDSKFYGPLYERISTLIAGVEGKKGGKEEEEGKKEAEGKKA